MNGKILVALLATLFSGACATGPEPQPKTLFIIIDGVSTDSLEAIATPNIDAIAAAGGYTHSWVGGILGTESETATISAPGYNHLVTGTWANKHNVYSNDIRNPDYSYWDIFRIARHHDENLKTGIFSTWLDNRTKLLGDGLDDAGGYKLDIYIDGLEHDEERFPPRMPDRYLAIDNQIAAEAARHVREYAPDLSWVYLQHTDNVGHEHGDSAEFDTAVVHADRQIGLIWDAILERQAEHNEDWLIIVTTDHGRSSATVNSRGRPVKPGQHHGGQSKRERTTWIVTNSRRLMPRFADNPPIVDILPSITDHMGIDIPTHIREQLDGQSFIEARR